jgi:hypothetical protein
MTSFKIENIMPGKTKLIQTAHVILVTSAFLLLSSFLKAQNETSSKTKDTLNIGFVLYTKGSSSGTLYARWNYANTWSGPGIATGGPKESGYAGNYHVRYFYENGEFSDEYDLEIKKTGDFYDVFWLVKGKVVAKGVGMEVENGLAVGWRRLIDFQKIYYSKNDYKLVSYN